MDNMRTLPDRFFANASRFTDRTCFASRRSEGWETLSWRESERMVRVISSNLVKQGIAPGDRIVLLSENRPEWALFNIAIMNVGAIVVPAYTTHTEIDLAHIIDLVGPAAAITSASTVQRFLLSARNSGGLKMLWAEGDQGSDSSQQFKMHSWDSLLTGELSDRVMHVPSLDDTCCLCLTSGTSGLPKAAMLTHRSIGANVDSAISILERFNFGSQDRFLSFLPLAHAYEHTAGLHMPISMGAEIWFCESTDKLQQYLPEVRPTVATAVPRLYDLLYNRINSQLANASPLKQKLFAKTLELGRKKIREESLSLVERVIDGVLDRIVRHKVRERFGGRIRYFVSGGAALNPEVGEFFTALGVGIIQGYGQTEASPLISVNSPDWVKLDSVGRPFEGVDVRLAADGELLVRGACVMKGYWEDPQATEGALMGGWLHTGDLATIDSDGFIRITGRKKDLIVTSGGDNIAPSKIEAMLCTREEIEQAVVFGDGRPWLGAIIVPSESGNTRTDQAVKEINAQLNSAEKIRKYIVRNDPCTTENGLLTPTQKIKRNRLIELHRSEIDALY